MFWFKDRSGLFIASILDKIVTNCENIHDKIFFLHLENNAKNQYYRFNVPQNMQQIMLDEWTKKDDIKIYADKYLKLNQTEQKLVDCVKRLRPSFQIIVETEGPRNQDRGEQQSPQRLQITQGGSNFQGSNLVYDGSQLQGNFIGSELGFFRQ